MFSLNAAILPELFFNFHEYFIGTGNSLRQFSISFEKRSVTITSVLLGTSILFILAHRVSEFLYFEF